MGALVTDSGRKTPARLAGSAILASQSDERLVELVRDGHERAFDAIVDRYRRSLVHYCAGILPESRTEDAVQQAFINAHAALRASDEPVQLKPWLYRITRNAALNMLRQNGWTYEQIPADFDGVQRPDQAVEQRFQLQRTVAAVNDLPDRQRDAIVMREFEGRSYEEIALVLGTGDGAVRQLLNRARGTLRAIATAVMPPPLVTRAAASMQPSDGRRVAELFGSIGAAGVVKVGATAVVAGSLVVGAVNAPLPLGSHHTPRSKATISAQKTSRAPSSARNETVAAAPDMGGGTEAGRGSQRFAARKNAAGNPGSGHGTSQPRHAAGAPAVQMHHGTRAPGDDHSGRSGSDDHHSSSGDTHSGSGDHSSSSDDSHSGSSDSGDSTTSGTSGGFDDSTSGTSGSGSDSTSGSSGSGSDDTVTVTTTDASSGSSGSGSSGDGSLSGTSGTSGSSDTSGSGTSGTTTTDN